MGDGVDEIRMPAGTLVTAASVELEHVPVEADQIVAGAPTTGHLVLDDSHGRTIGVWEMTPGAMRDVEDDEVFVVLAGAATVEFEHPTMAEIVLAPGSVVRLDAGMRTLWTVRQTLRKVYVSP
ncbi:cupin domain-containing protein [Agromyces sp. Marseille-P2726]|uniref:cupin domain-containing protein n=1 Tax=Agromyces sp. Marseille-P2726 TaxID=2709132 RepID=UPI0020C591F6|nr:cupin domain-containing protein [Agromyces sp. Marseille-P2726]